MLRVRQLTLLDDGEIGVLVVKPHALESFFLSNGNVNLMQFTGLLDKNGKEIYEGDLLRIKSLYETGDPVDSAPNEVYFKEGSFRIAFHNGVLNSAFCTGELGSNWEVEVIGNIYENPELLEKRG
jgi:uncharacterized phage protein (TIGR01671 family)